MAMGKLPVGFVDRWLRKAPNARFFGKSIMDMTVDELRAIVTMQADVAEQTRKERQRTVDALVTLHKMIPPGG